jgi:hypothetical protein
MYCWVVLLGAGSAGLVADDEMPGFPGVFLRRSAATPGFRPE